MILLKSEVVRPTTEENKAVIDQIRAFEKANIDFIYTELYDLENGKEAFLSSYLDKTTDKVHLTVSTKSMRTGETLEIDKFIAQEGAFGINIECILGNEKRHYYAIIDNIVLKTYEIN